GLRQFAARRTGRRPLTDIDADIDAGIDALKSKTPTPPLHFTPDPVDNKRLANLCGPMDENLRQIAAALDVSVFRRGEKFIVSGANASRALAILEKFHAMAERPISVDDVQLALVEQRATEEAAAAREPGQEGQEAHPVPVLKTRRSDLQGRTPNQNQYL